MKSMGNLRRLASRALATPHCSTLAQEHVIRGVWHATAVARPVARVVELPADRIDALYRRDVRKHAAAGNHIEFEPGDVICRRARGAGGDPPDHRAAVAQLPGRAGKMAADNLVVRN